MRRSLLIVALAALMVMAFGASAALAGEITGNGTPLWTVGGVEDEHHEIHGKSLCAFSGQNDGYHLESQAHDEFDALQRTQSWGQIPNFIRKQLRAGGVEYPGFLCNPHKLASFGGGE